MNDRQQDELSLGEPGQARRLLLAAELEPGEAAVLLARYGFRDPVAADENLQRLAGEPHARRLLAEIVDDLLESLSLSADADGALNRLERLGNAALNRSELFSYLHDARATIELLARALGASPFMAEILIRDPGLLYWVSDPEVLHSVRTRAQLTQDLSDLATSFKTEEGRADALRIFKRKEILHLGVRDVLRLTTVEQTLDALSVLAEVLIAQAARAAHEAIGNDAGAGLAVLALGKLGGAELNFSSDVDLLYVGADEGASPLSAARQRQLAQKITCALAEASHEGYVYRVDLRLRPEGRMGPLVVPLSAAREYYATRGATWERLALSKAAPVGGDRALAAAFLSVVEPFVYGNGLTLAEALDIRRMKDLIDDSMTQRGETLTNVKLGTGGIREIEIVAQTLQIAYGGRSPAIRRRGTREALGALRAAGLLTSGEAARLTTAYVFLRDLENKLQMVEDVQSHALPAQASDLHACALRLGFRSADDLLAAHRHHTHAVNEVFRALFEPPGIERLVST